MSVTSGFFNSLNGDRKYNAEQMSAIFDGIINNGVFANIGTTFSVTAGSEKNEIVVGIGRAWFNSAWIYNDSPLVLQTDISEIVLDRYDAVVIEVNHDESVRSGSIKIVKGVPASSPNKPTLTNTDRVHQYPIAYIYRKANSETISQADITNAVGTSACPYITGILQVTNIDNIVAKWEGEWEEWSGQWSTWTSLWNQWFSQQAADVENDTAAWMSQMQSAFEVWFRSIQVVLDGDVATNLANGLVELNDRFSVLASERAVYEKISDSSNGSILDSFGNPIEGRTVMGVSDNPIGSSEITSPDQIGAANAIHANQHAHDGIDPITPEMINARPNTWTPSWNEVTEKPSTFPPETHTHSADDVGARPNTWVPSWGDISGKPSTFPPEAHNHAWNEVTSKPSTFPPEAHYHMTKIVDVDFSTDDYSISGINDRIKVAFGTIMNSCRGLLVRLFGTAGNTDVSKGVMLFLSTSSSNYLFFEAEVVNGTLAVESTIRPIINKANGQANGFTHHTVQFAKNDPPSAFSAFRNQDESKIALISDFGLSFTRSAIDTFPMGISLEIWRIDA